MKKLFLLFALCAMLFAVRSVFAQTPIVSSQAVSPTSAVQLTFPISALGNCSSASDCKTYCDDPTHVDACVAYAKEKGFYKESTLDSDQQTVLADAKATLGCDNETSCRTFCADETNADACSAFAQKHNLKGGKTSLDNITLEKAKAAFGCDSAESCRAFCEKAENREKCAAFAKANGLKGGNEKVGPGGCTSESSCKVFCADPNNFQVCSRFAGSHGGSTSGERKFVGPGGCTSEASCREYCTQNPTACHTPLLSGTPRPTGLDYHPSTTPGGPTLTPEQYCHMYPDHCANLTPQPKADGPLTQTPAPTKGPTPNYSEYCQSKGCSFTGTTCLCPTPTKAQSTSGSGNTSTPTPSTHESTPTPTGSVHAAATERNFFQWLMESFFHVK